MAKSMGLEFIVDQEAGNCSFKNTEIPEKVWEYSTIYQALEHVFRTLAEQYVLPSHLEVYFSGFSDEQFITGKEVFRTYAENRPVEIEFYRTKDK